MGRRTLAAMTLDTMMKHSQIRPGDYSGMGRWTLAAMALAHYDEALADTKNEPQYKPRLGRWITDRHVRVT